jgi:hypothetical protein
MLDGCIHGESAVTSARNESNQEHLAFEVACEVLKYRANLGRFKKMQSKNFYMRHFFSDLYILW